VLTGESVPAVKSATAASGVVVRTGAGTAFGQIAAGVAEKHAQTAFEAGLSRFSRFLFAVAAVLTAFIFIINVSLSRPLIDALLFSLAIAVGIAPEMMPAIVTVSLSADSKALAAKKVLVTALTPSARTLVPARPIHLVSLPAPDTAARPASSRAMGTRNGEQDT
jgi:Mg2+-importing ATPase